MTTDWKIFDTKYQITDGLITKVTYGCIVQLENFIDRTIGELDLTGNPSSPGFIPYSLLTEQVIIDWVKTLLGSQQVEGIETSLQDNITALKAEKDAETEKSGLPWN
jgi:hypothetical protein